MILISFGTRPEYLKLKNIINNLNIPKKILFTGQHVDLLKDLKVDNIFNLGISSKNRLDNLVIEILQRINNSGVMDDVDSVMVQGDTTTAFAVALAAFHRKLKVYHVESGLRSSDNFAPFPEEFNRRSISVISNVHFCPTTEEFRTLKKEGINGSFHIVGNTGLDNLKTVKTSTSKKVLITIHRRENHDKIENIFSQISKLSQDFKDFEFLIPLHPNPNVQKFKHLLKSVKVLEPLEHSKFLDILKDCCLVITDSGGVQEESCFLGKRIISVRKPEETERFDDNTIHTLQIYEVGKLELLKGLEYLESYKGCKCPYGDGKSSEKICKILEEEYKNGKAY